jgi:hypothetical protein
MKMKTWIEENGEELTDECLVCDAALRDVVAVEDGVCGVCLATQ